MTFSELADSLALELVIHCVLYEDFAHPVVSDREFDILQVNYFDLCLRKKLIPNPCLNPYTGLLNAGTLTTEVKALNLPQLVQKYEEVLDTREWDLLY